MSWSSVCLRALCWVTVLSAVGLSCSSELDPGDALWPQGMDAAAGPVRSALYPNDWQPGRKDAQGRFLHDFSYAGYRNGEQPFPALVGRKRIDVVTDFAADRTGASDATRALQAALDAATPGSEVFIPSGQYRIDGLLKLATSGVALRGEGAAKSVLRFTKTAAMTDRDHLTIGGALRSATLLPLAADAPALTHSVTVADARGLRVGDDVSVGWVITPEFVADHQMTEVWTQFVNQWKPMFRRRIVGIDVTQSPHRVTLDVPLRHPARLRDQAALRPESGYLSDCLVEQLGLTTAGPWDEVWKSQRSHALALIGVKDCVVRSVASVAAAGQGGYHLANGGLLIRDSQRVTVERVTLSRAQNRGDGGSGYLFEVSTSSEILFADSQAEDGRHNFIQNWDFGCSGVVWQRIASTGSRAFTSVSDKLGFPAASEFHHSLAMANLIEQARIDDAWQAINRLYWSSGAGHTATETVLWNLTGSGRILSQQFGHGYIIGTQGVEVLTGLDGISARGTAPEDFVELRDEGARIDPPSLYDDQLRRRLERGERLWPQGP